MEYKVFGIIKSKYKYANIDINVDIIRATNLEGAINKFKKKYPKHIISHIIPIFKGKECYIIYNKYVVTEYKAKYGDKMNLDGR